MIELRVSDIKQYIYCPRIIYFYYVLPVHRRITRKMEYGKLEHIEVVHLEKRRKLKAYGLSDGERKYNVYLKSERMGLRGVIDMIITTKNGDVFPVEFKHSLSKEGLHQKYQLTAYAMLLEEVFERPVRYGFIYLIPSKTAHIIEITVSMREHIKKVLAAIRNIVLDERLPRYLRSKMRCTDCEYKNYCADTG